MSANNNFKFKLLSLIAGITRVFHPFGAERFLRLIYHPDKRKNDNFQTVIKYNEDSRININSASFIEWLIFFFGYYEIEIVRLIKNLIKPEFICFDIGANIGVHSLIMAKKCSSVFAFEPNPSIFKKLLSNIALNGFSNIAAIQLAISSFSGQSSLYFDKNNSNQGTATLNKPAESESEGINVDVTTVDDFVERENIGRLDLLKSDTEGNDYKVLLGAKKSISRFRPYLLFEYEATGWAGAGFDLKNLKEFLTPLGYEIFEIKRNKIVPLGDSPAYANIFARPKDIK